MSSLLQIEGLEIEFPTRKGIVSAARNVSLSVKPGEILGLVGESGAGKSTIGNAIVNLLEPPGRIAKGSILFQGQELRDLDQDQMRKIRGNKIGMIFQDPQTSLNPLMPIGKQLVETLEKALGLRGGAAQTRAVELLEAVGIPEAPLRLKSYPHQLSGGLRQRVVIALALCGDPELIIADEPTTALDVSIQAQILDLIKGICHERQVGMILVTHDIGVIANTADRVCVMYRGEVVETGDVAQVIGKPQHEYTKSLIAAVPRPEVKLERFASIDYIEDAGERRYLDVSNHWLGADRVASTAEPAIEINNLKLDFTLRKALLRKNRRYVHAVDAVSLEVKQGETLGIVGESGSGKSTIAKLVTGIHQPNSGAIRVLGHDILGKQSSAEAKAARRALQMVFQDPYSSLNSRMKVMDIVAEPIRYYKTAESEIQARQIVHDLLDHIGLGAQAARKYPHEFSGGQRQRISIARALASRPQILICDEPTSALDVSIQAQILNLLKDLQDELGLTMLFISHDLPVIRQMCDRVAVMKSGKICEVADTTALFQSPQHSYTKHLLSLMPNFDMIHDSSSVP